MLNSSSWVNSPAQAVALAGNIGKYKADLPIGQLLLRSFMTGLYVGVGTALATICSTGVAANFGPGIARLITAVVFPIALMPILLTGMELFTASVMLCPMAIMQGKSTWGPTLRNFLFVYIGNAIGSMFYAYMAVMGPFTTGNLAAAEPTLFGMNAVMIAVAKTLAYKDIGAMGLWSAFISGIGCNFLVNIALTFFLVAKDFTGKIIGIWFPVMAFVATGFEHSIANFYFCSAGKWVFDYFPGLADKMVDDKYWSPLLHKYGAITWSDILLWNILPVTIGNFIGGCVLLGCILFFSYRGELPEENRKGYQAPSITTVGK